MLRVMRSQRDDVIHKFEKTLNNSITGQQVDFVSRVLSLPPSSEEPWERGCRLIFVRVGSFSLQTDHTGSA